MLRIDKLAELGCCCFCTILYIANDKFIAENPEKVKKFLRGVKKATDYMLSNPKEAWAEYGNFKPNMQSELNTKKFSRCFAYFSDSLYNVHRDWRKVNNLVKDWKFYQLIMFQTTPMNTYLGQNQVKFQIH